MAYTTINKSTDYFNTKLYTGNGGTLNVTGVGFQPDFTWIKSRVAAHSHLLQDAVRGVLQTLNSNDNSADDTISNGLTAFGTDGFTVGGNGSFNSNTDNYVSWNWKANGAGSSNTDGSITSTVSANTTSGFSIVSYTGNATSGATVGHGLGAVPKMIIVKKLNGTASWTIYNSNLSTGASSYLYLNSTDAEGTNYAGYWNSTTPTSSVFTLGNAGDTNGNTNTYIAYCFADVTGYSKFGSYVGNGNADGPFIYTGFKPAFVMFKNTSSALFWQIHDSARDPFNEVQKRLAPNSSDAEGSGSIPIDFYSNGIKLRTTATTWNESGSTFIYMAFAENPLVSSNNIPATAR